MMKVDKAPTTNPPVKTNDSLILLFITYSPLAADNQMKGRNACLTHHVPNACLINKAVGRGRSRRCQRNASKAPRSRPGCDTQDRNALSMLDKEEPTLFQLR